MTGGESSADMRGRSSNVLACLTELFKEIIMKKGFRKILEYVCVFAAILLNMPISAVAAQEGTTILNTPPHYELRERVGRNNSVIKTYTKETTTQAAGLSPMAIEETKSILLDLGLSLESINHMSDEKLEHYANASQIFSVTSFMIVKPDGETIYTTENVVLEKAERVNQQIADMFKSYATNSNEVVADLNDRDGALELNAIISHTGNGHYLYDLEATWHSMPAFRYVDSLGAVAEVCSVVNNTRNGNYTYTTVYSDATGTRTETETEYLYGNSDFKNDEDGEWSGTAALINLPNDVTIPDSSYISMVTTLTANVSFVTRVTYPNQETNFNVVATYSHGTLNFSPSIDISYPSGVSASIGIKGGSDDCNVQTDRPISYVP